MPKRRNARSRRSSSVKPSTVLLSIGVGSLLAIAVVAVVLVARGGSGEGVSRNKPQTPVVTSSREVTVKVIDNDYEPRDLTVSPGARVTWLFEGRLPHTVTADDGSFNSGIMNRGEQFTVTLNDPGTFSYYCTLHHAMQGKVTVSEEG